jgi:hypothetical protein
LVLCVGIVVGVSVLCESDQPLIPDEQSEEAMSITCILHHLQQLHEKYQ